MTQENDKTLEIKEPETTEVEVQDSEGNVFKGKEGKVQLILVVTDVEVEKELFIRQRIHPADSEVRREQNKIVSAADLKNDVLFIFKKPIEGSDTLMGLDDVHGVEMTGKSRADMHFYLKLAELVNKVDERTKEIDNGQQ